MNRNIFWVPIFGIAGVAESQDCIFCINEFRFFFALNFWNRRSRRVAGSQFQYKKIFFWVTIFGIAGVAESQDCRFSINGLKYFFLLLIIEIAGVAESQDCSLNIKEIFFG